MTLDDKGREDVFAFLQDKGYTGSLADWWAEMRRQSYHSEIRLFDKIWVPSLGPQFPEAQAFIRQVLRIAESHFDSVRSSSQFYLHLSFSKSTARRCEKTQRPLRLDGLALDIKQDDNTVEVRFRLYVNNEFRRDRYFVFHPTSIKEGSSWP